MATPPATSRTRISPNLWLVTVVLVVVALAITGIIVALVTSRTEATLPASSPEGVVQRYLRALENRRYEDAYTYLNAATKQQCPLEEFIRATSYRPLEDSEMVLDDTKILGDSAIVTARVTVFEPGNIFDSSEYSYTETFDLTRDAGQWRMKWEAYRCPPSF
jgi:hypothetical protein